MKSLSARLVNRFLPLLILILFGGVTLTSGKLTGRTGGADEPEPASETGTRPDPDEWVYEQRAYPAKVIPPGARARAVEQLEALEARQSQARVQRYGKAAAAVIAQQSQPRWEALGPQPIAEGQTFGAPAVAVSGRVSALALDPGYDGAANQTVYVGGAQGGVWRSTNNGLTWTPLLDEQPSLAVGSIAIHPFNPRVLYVGTGEGNRAGDCYYGAGLLKSVDGGATWRVLKGAVAAIEPRIPSFQYAAIGQLAIDPVTPDTLFACTTVGATSGPSGGVVAYSPGQFGLLKSTDGGESWRNVDPGNTNGMFSAHDVLIDPRDHTRVYAGMRTIGLFRSTAGGEPGTWQRLANGLPDPTDVPANSPFRRMALAAGPPLGASPNSTVYAAMAGTDDNLLGIFRSTDGGDSWTSVNRPQTGGQVNYNIALAVDPVDANVVYYGTQANALNSAGTVFRSLDGGQTWSDLSTGNGSGGLHADTHALVVAPKNRQVVFTGNDGGIWRSDNATSPSVGWTTLNGGLSLTQFQSLALHPTDPNFLIGGTQDNGTNRFNGALAWAHIRDGDGGFVLIDQANPQVLYHTFFNQNNAGGQRAQIGPEVSLNGGSTWARRGCFSCTAQAGNFNPADRVGFYAPLAQHTGFTGANGNVVYCGTHRLYRSANLGLTWTGLGASADGFGQDLTISTTGSTTGRLSAIAAHPLLDASTDPPGETVWTGSNNGQVFVTTEAGKLAGAVFANVTKAPLPNRFISHIAVDPNERRRAYVAFSGFNAVTPATPGHVFVTDDLGQSWRDISGDLPDVPVTAVEPDPTQAGTLYIGTDLGVFQTTDGGATWVRLGNGLPRVATFMLRYHSATRSLVAATHGRGMFRLKLAAPVVTVSSASFSRDALAVEGIASAFGTGLATRSEAAQSLPLPTELAGTTVRLTDANGAERLAPLFFVSPQQINYQIPPELASGAVTVSITSGDNAVSFGIERVRDVAPALFAANANGRGVPAGYGVRARAGVLTSFPIATQAPPLQPAEIDLGPEGDQVVLVLFGTGLRRRPDLSGVDVSIGGVRVPAQYAGEVAGLVGLDQLNFGVPRSLSGKGEVDVSVNASGAAGNTLRVRIK